jgi:hypothetical protein
MARQMKLDHVAIWTVDLELMRTFYEKYFDAQSSLNIKMNALTKRLHTDGFPLLDGPRQTGDGYYESMVADRQGNRIVVAE